MSITDYSPNDRSAEVYIGDAVYASFADGMIRLRTGDGNNQVIYLEPAVMAALVEYAKRVGVVE
jgi:hypothetical protein